ncbi:UDP-2,4-diacetamido-2,4,6-trideoxy-beta-L-altropyranose hydrolase [Vibrio sp. D420a]|uniref:UDP-2,4-diacetamido-2,4, 6-trideoxy-beta-L-altropyranose hydrolase n=1 Tax=Vibrio sp. D420a TaxID=2836895 RepID=UPI0025527E92|nr:UDP-2,4-diacetamido-2,4,6-trideoxy-beta-L-altropyranose hydrolase [Vibrio sp. D420a]MDK9762842.1 UDP-2,4-diacetamido-2,4,6-trideoxy-beta-L-altropyranose hydrolase [Vibrio sp. D420a]
MKKIIFRVDASVWIGSGHVMRCLVLADELTKHSYQVAFACLPQKGDLCHFIQERGYSVIELTPPELQITPKHSSDYIGWLQRSIQEDIDDLVPYLDGVDWVICDHYALGQDWQKQIKQRTGVRILAIDDLVRKHCADIVVDQTLSRTAIEYETTGMVLAGVDYALLSPNFSELRSCAEDRQPNLDNPRILISMGGVDLPNATFSVLKSLESKNVRANITVLMSPRSPHYSQVSDWCKDRDNIEHIDFTNYMAQMMLEHDIAIGAPGSTSWERACLGLPSIVVPLADNQKDICHQLVAENLSRKVELNSIASELFNTYREVCSDWHQMHLNNLRACDGLGTRRVVSEIIELENENNNFM